MDAAVVQDVRRPNAVRLQLHALAYDLGNFLRTLATPEPIKDWTLTSLKDKLIKIGAKVVSHGRYVAFQMAEVAIPRQMFQEYCGSSRNCGRSRHLRQHETFDVHAFKGNRREECAQFPEKWPDQVARPSSGGRGMEAAVGTAHRSCGKAGKVFNLHANSGSSGECRIKEVIMADNVLYRFSGQACYEVDTGRLKKIRVVFGMIDEKRTSMAWYLFSSNGVAKSKRELANPDPMPPEQFGHRTVGGRDIPHTFKKKIGLDELAINPKGTPAILTLDVSQTKRFLECRIDILETKAKEVVSFPFGLQFDSDPSTTGKIHGKVLFLEIAPFDANKFPLGPQGKAKFSITGPGL